jgi:hypothetical protein
MTFSSRALSSVFSITILISKTSQTFTEFGKSFVILIFSGLEHPVNSNTEDIINTIIFFISTIQ